MSHFGPYQSQLVYEGLASQFRHDAVLVSITPENDFVDLVFETSDSLARRP